VIGVLGASGYLAEHGVLPSRGSGPPTRDVHIPPYDQWVRYVSEEGGYEALFPTTPTQTNLEADTTLGRRKVNRVGAIAESTSFEIAYYDAGSVQYEIRYLEGIRDYAEQSGGTATDVKDWFCQGRAGMRATILENDGTRSFIAFLAIRGRSFALTQEGAPTESTADFEFFINSLILSDRALGIAPLAASVTSLVSQLHELPLEVDVHVVRGRSPYTASIKSARQAELQINPWLNGFRIGGRFAEPGNFDVRGTVVDADGRTADFSTNVIAKAMPDSIGDVAVKLSINNRIVPYEQPRVELEPFGGFTAYLKFEATTGPVEVVEWNCNPSEVPGGFIFESRAGRGGEAKLIGIPVEVGKWQFTVSCKTRVDGTQRIYERSAEFEVERPPLNPKLIPDEPGFFVAGAKYQGKEGASMTCTFKPVLVPTGGRDWPCEVTWSWDEESVPKGTLVRVDPDGIVRLDATHGKPGLHTVVITCTIKLQYIDTPYVMKRDLTYRIFE
jgi:hypothetical protein